METSVEIQCPWCGETFSVLLDPQAGSQSFITDCEICCRPMQVNAAVEDGEILGLDVQAG